MRRALLAALAIVAITACGASPRTPSEVVAAYFEGLGRDPIRTLPLTTDAFHRQHGLRLATAAAAPDRVDREQVAWLAVLSRPELTRLAREMTTRVVDAGESGDTAWALVHVESRAAPAFEQRFDLVRESAASAWRIDAALQLNVAEAALSVAFAAHPTEERRQQLERRAHGIAR